MVRRPPAVLAGAVAFAIVQVSFLAVHGLPRLHPGDLSLFVAATVAATGIHACVAAVIGVSDDLRALTAITVAGLVLVAVLAVADVGAAATPVEAVAYAALGARLAVGVLAPPVALALPLLAAVVDLASTLGGGLSEHLANATATKSGDPLSLELPDWGNGLSAGRMGLSDAIFAGVFLLLARRLGLRPWTTLAAFWLMTVAAIGLHLGTDAAIPLIPLFALAYYAINADRLRVVVEHARRR